MMMPGLPRPSPFLNLHDLPLALHPGVCHVSTMDRDSDIQGLGRVQPRGSAGSPGGRCDGVDFREPDSEALRIPRQRPTFLRPRLRFWGLLSAAATVSCFATFLGFLGRWHWFLDLFSHFRVQYLAAQLILGALFFLIRWRRTATLCMACACFNLMVLLPTLFRYRSEIPEAAPLVRVMLLNVNSTTGDAARVRELIASERPDLFVLQEVTAQWLRDLGASTNAYPHQVLVPREDNFGIALFSRIPLLDRRVEYVGRAGVPSVFATFRSADREVLVVGSHPVPPAGGEYTRWRNEQLSRLPDFVPGGQTCLLLGDLNVTPWHPRLRALLDESCLVDSARWSGLQPTWHRGNPVLALPLDYCLHSPDVLVVNRKIGPEVGSDHRPLIATLALPPPRHD
jgi:endonuclease/exonuclease/phosphatase (EEP) superfamily protein YafD